tara:strand:+ start:485 stop:1027 length:543 start_codon:yes stop_codon:yes gene_type:complete
MFENWHWPVFYWFIQRAIDLQLYLLPAEVILLAVFLIIRYLITGVIEPRILKFSANKSHLQILRLFMKIMKLAVVVMGTISALGTIGVDVTSLVAVTGLFSFAVGFAMQDALSNVLSGVMILLHQPFKVGDHIKVLAFGGEVVQIDLRYTHVRTDSDIALIPNKTLFQAPVIVCGDQAKD